MGLTPGGSIAGVAAVLVDSDAAVGMGVVAGYLNKIVIMT
jgi:hypothetical protein